MANPTTNYGFVLPTPTSLVTNLPADFDVALQGVDTRIKALEPGTTAGDIAYSSATANTNVRLPIGSTGQVLAVVAGVPAWATTADQTPLTTKGDVFTFSTLDARLGVGANNTVLTADSTASTGLKYSMPASLATNARTASYTLVAADAGTRVTMNSASATTATINTGLFAANDVVQITNLGVGVLTITAGTATVSTAGVLTLAQNASGSLYFTSTGVSIWQGSAAVAASGGMTSIASGTLSGASVSLTSISGSYKDLILRLSNYSSNGDSFGVSYRYNNLSGNNYRTTGVLDANALAFNATEIDGSNNQDTTAGDGFIQLQIFDYAGSTWKVGRILAITNDATTPTNFSITNVTAIANITAAISRIDIFSDGADFDGGTYVLYGVN